jgi:hypothetical protein
MNQLHRLKHAPLSILLACALLLAGCNLPSTSSEASPTPDVTQAYATLYANLTQAVAQTPSPTPPPPSATPTPPQTTASPSATAATPAPSATATLALALTSPTPGCDLAAAGVPIDITIPDDTKMAPGQAFTKTWRLVNVGNCTWTKDYAVKLFSGEAMGARDTVALTGNVSPGQTVEISVEMVAPARPGTYQGNWKLGNAANALFGIGPGGTAPFWVRIIVVATTGTPTLSTLTVTPATPTVTVTPPSSIKVNGPAVLTPGLLLDLDTLRVVTGGEADLSYESDPNGQHPLVPTGGALLGVFGMNQPSQNDCRSASLTSSPIAAEGLSIGTFLCYRTNGGLTGRAQVTNFNIDTYTLSLDVLTWAQP